MLSELNKVGSAKSVQRDALLLAGHRAQRAARIADVNVVQLHGQLPGRHAAVLNQDANNRDDFIHTGGNVLMIPLVEALDQAMIERRRVVIGTAHRADGAAGQACG